MTETIGNAVAKRDESSPSRIIDNARTDLAQVMPSHVRADTWVRVAQGVVRRDKKLAEAAQQSPGSLMVAMMEAARLGLEPGTEQYYLTPRKNKGTPEILGIVGYQGYIELMYRSGAVDSVVVEVVRKHDTFRWVSGKMQRPEHEADWFATDDERGQLVGVYAYAEMTGGATSKVVVLNRDDIARAKESAQGAHTSSSPWQTNEVAMWLKTGARRLAKWVPTSSEDRRIVHATAERTDGATLPDVSALAEVDEPDPLADPLADAVDGEIVDDETSGDGWPPVAQPGSKSK